MKNDNQGRYLIKVINDSEVLSQKELVNLVGGVNEVSEVECTCDCWCGNSNTTTKKDELSTK